jgi:hypothetical protein
VCGVLGGALHNAVLLPWYMRTVQKWYTFPSTLLSDRAVVASHGGERVRWRRPGTWAWRCLNRDGTWSRRTMPSMQAVVMGVQTRIAVDRRNVEGAIIRTLLERSCATQHSSPVVRCVPDNPATVSWEAQDVGQWLCVPRFRVVCFFRPSSVVWQIAVLSCVSACVAQNLRWYPTLAGRESRRPCILEGTRNACFIWKGCGTTCRHSDAGGPAQVPAGHLALAPQHMRVG